MNASPRRLGNPAGAFRLPNEPYLQEMTTTIYQNPNELPSKLLMDGSLSHRAFRLWHLFLCLEAHDAHSFTYSTASQQTGMGERGLLDALRELEARGLVTTGRSSQFGPTNFTLRHSA